jgi:hypothetical protein
MARARVLKHFTEEEFLRSYASTYSKLRGDRSQQFLPAYHPKSEYVCG